MLFYPTLYRQQSAEESNKCTDHVIAKDHVVIGEMKSLVFTLHFADETSMKEALSLKCFSRRKEFTYVQLIK